MRKEYVNGLHISSAAILPYTIKFGQNLTEQAQKNIKGENFFPETQCSSYSNNNYNYND